MYQNNKGLKQNTKENIPVFIAVGPSGGGKSDTDANLAKQEYANPMSEYLTGKGMTTNCEYAVTFSPNVEGATITLELKEEETVRADLVRNIKEALEKVVKNSVASISSNTSEVDLRNKAEEESEIRMKFKDERFKLAKIFAGGENTITKIFQGMIFETMKKSIDVTFKKKFNEINKEDSQTLKNMISITIDEVLKAGGYVDTIYELTNKQGRLILEGEKMVLSDENMYVSETLDAEKFGKLLKKISNSSKEILENIPSIACLLLRVKITVPGEGIIVEDNSIPQEYTIIDMVGLDNDGLDKVPEVVKETLFTKYRYNGIIYFASNKVIDKTHESFLRMIYSSNRPASMVVVSTFADLDDIYDDDEYPTRDAIIESNKKRKKQILDIIKLLDVNLSKITIPSASDIVCVSNKISTKKHGDDAVEFYKGAYNEVRTMLGEAIKKHSKKIEVKNIIDKYLVPERAIEDYIGDTVASLCNVINEEYLAMKFVSSKIHHWTLDAVIWNLLSGYDFYSNAQVWLAIKVLTYSNLQKALKESFGEFKFAPEIACYVSTKKDAESIKAEFWANLDTELYAIVRKLIINGNKSYAEQLRTLAKKSKADKAGIIEELRLILLKAVEEKDYLNDMLTGAVQDALSQTKAKLIV